MKRSALLFLILMAAWGKAWGYGLPPISVGEDQELLTDTPLPFLTYTPTHTATPSPTFTFTPTPTAENPLSVPTLAETVTLPVVTPATSKADRPSDHSPALDLSRSGSNSFREQLFLEAGLGTDLPLQGLSVPGTAAGAEAALGILFKDGFAVEIDFETFSRSNTDPNGTLSGNEMLVLPSLRRYFWAGHVRPYLSIGDGMAVNTTTSELVSSSVASFDLALGGGLEFVFEDYFCTYVEGKYNFVFMSASPTQDIPVVIGARLGL